MLENSPSVYHFVLFSLTFTSKLGKNILNEIKIKDRIKLNTSYIFVDVNLLQVYKERGKTLWVHSFEIN